MEINKDSSQSEVSYVPRLRSINLSLLLSSKKRKITLHSEKTHVTLRKIMLYFYSSTFK